MPRKKLDLEKAVKMRSSGHNFREIADECGFRSTKAAREVISAELNRRYNISVVELRQREAASLDEMADVLRKHLATDDFQNKRERLYARSLLRRLATQRFRLTGKRVDYGPQEDNN
jgi:AraC-like DNA-binding protein